jgi:quercetin 2,3-dioxygenase
VGVFHIAIQPSKTYTLPATEKGTTRTLYIVEGESTTLESTVLQGQHVVSVREDSPLPIKNSGTDTVEILVLQGKPINEPVVQHGPFVMNSAQEIRQAFMDYSETSFGGWPWNEEAVIFPREKGRFNLVNGKTILPPSSSK